MSRIIVVGVIIGSLVGAQAVVAADSPESAETLREQRLALEREQSPAPEAAFSGESAGALRGTLDGMLMVGVDDTALSTWVIDPATDTGQAAFTGGDVWGLAVIPGGTPGSAEVYIAGGSTLYRWQDGGTIETCCTMTLGGTNQSMVSAAYDPTGGRLLFTKNISTEGVYSLAVTPGACPVSCEVTLEWTYDAAANDIGGIAWDDATGTLYGTNDDSDGPRGVFALNPDGTTTLVVAYPAGETDIDGLAFGDGKLFLVTDEPGDFYVYNLGTASFETPLTSPWTTAETFCGAAFGTGILIPVELQSFGVE